VTAHGDLPGKTKYLMLGPRMASVSTVTVDLFFGVILTVFKWVFIWGSTAARWVRDDIPSEAVRIGFQ
jgi:hypothetical protein